MVFAGNPLNYGDRELSALFKRHGNTVEFKPLSCAFIYERIIKPVFENTDIASDDINIIATELLAVYQFIAELSVDNVLISPREVQMMALLVSNYYRQHPDISTNTLKNVAKHYAHTMELSLVPDIDQQRQRFSKAFPPIEIAHLPITTTVTSEFFPTASRIPTLQRLHDVITLREHHLKIRPEGETLLNEAPRYGGLGGLIIGRTTQNVTGIMYFSVATEQKE